MAIPTTALGPAEQWGLQFVPLILLHRILAEFVIGHYLEGGSVMDKS